MDYQKTNPIKEAINNINFDFYDKNSGIIRNGMVEPTKGVETRRNHFYRGMDPEMYHLYLDGVYNKYLDDQDVNKKR